MKKEKGFNFTLKTPSDLTFKKQEKKIVFWFKFIKNYKKKVFNFAFIIFLLFVIGFSSRQIYVLNVHKQDTIINVTGSAQVLNTPNYLYFTGYNANTTLNNDTHEFAGYAWSTDVGWVAFGAAGTARHCWRRRRRSRST